jgi:hypothetical protein
MSVSPPVRGSVVYSALCRECGDVEVDVSMACPTCGKPVPRESASKPRIVQAPPAAALAAPAEPAKPQQRVVVPTGRSARRWGQAQRALLADLEAEEETARVAYEAAKERYQAVRRARASIANVCSLIVVDESASEAAPVRQRGGSKPSERWARNYDACIECGRTVVKHASKGRCGSCADRRRRAARGREATP